MSLFQVSDVFQNETYTLYHVLPIVYGVAIKVTHPIHVSPATSPATAGSEHRLEVHLHHLDAAHEAWLDK